MKAITLFTASLITMSAFSPALFADSASISAEQKKEFEKVVHDYLVQNPEVLVEASQVLQQKQQAELQNQAKEAIAKNANDLFLGNISIAGNPDGSVTLIEFFDYQCIHCKEMRGVVEQLVKNNKNLRVIYKEFPIFGKTSEMASRASIAAAMQGKYVQLHTLLLKAEKRLDEKAIMQAAKTAGLNMKKLKTDMNSQKVTSILTANRSLAEKIHLMGTPAFIVASTPNGQFKENSKPAFIPGAASEKSIQDLINQAAT